MHFSDLMRIAPRPIAPKCSSRCTVSPPRRASAKWTRPSSRSLPAGPAKPVTPIAISALRPTERALGHCPCDGLRHGVILLENALRNAEQVALGFLGIGHEAAVEAVTGSLDVREQRREHSARAALGRGDRKPQVAQAMHQPFGLLVQMIRKSRLKRLAQPRSPSLSGG